MKSCAWLVVALAMGCSGGGKHRAVVAPGTDGVAVRADAGLVGPVTDVRAAGDPTWGLDVRPANATCKAFARPPTGAVLKRTRVFARVPFKVPVAMVQAPGDATRFFVVEKTGKVVTVPAGNDAVTVATPFV